MILYHSDVTIDHGPTYVVSQEPTEHRDLVTDGYRMHGREKFAELYEQAKPVTVPAGSVLIYNSEEHTIINGIFVGISLLKIFLVRTFHRGSSMLAKAGSRFIHFTAFHTPHATWARLDASADNVGLESDELLFGKRATGSANLDRVPTCRT